MDQSAQRLFLTGATGFFGRSILRWLLKLESPDKVRPRLTALTRDPGQFLRRYPEFSGHAWLEFHQGDISSPETLPASGRFSHILHAAADSTNGHILNPLARFDQILGGTRNILDFAVAVGARRFLYTSSGAVYGEQAPRTDGIPETLCSAPDPMLQNNAYGVAKYAAEHLCALYHQHHGLETVVARCFAFVGGDLPLNAHFAIGNFIRDALSRPEIVVRGDGTAVRSYLHQDDLAAWLMSLLSCGAPTRIYNVGSDKAVTIADLAYQVRDILAPDKTVRILEMPSNDGMRSYYVPDIRRAQSELGLKVGVPLPDAIARTGAYAAASDAYAVTGGTDMHIVPGS